MSGACFGNLLVRKCRIAESQGCLVQMEHLESSKLTEHPEVQDHRSSGSGNWPEQKWY
jgi:hypothetical protein